MLFFLAAFLAILLTVPGMLIISRTRLASSVSEIISCGFFFGMSITVFFYLSLCRYIPVVVVDVLLCCVAALSLPLLILELRRKKFPMWQRQSVVQPLLVLCSLAFMLISTFSQLSEVIDEDLFVHFPNIKRISMGDVPPHLYCFPDTFLRGHVARDVYTGIIAKALNLPPELAIIYVTLAACPFYILVFQALAQRLAGKNQVEVCFCLFGLLYLVSFDVGGTSIRAGAITYVTNNNLFAYSHAAFIGWLLERISSKLVSGADKALIPWLKSNMTYLTLCAFSYASLYYVYISNFLMYSIFLPCLSLLPLIAVKTFRVRIMFRAVSFTSIVVVTGLLLHVCTSPLFLERFQISVNNKAWTESMAATQQARLSFPKSNVFSISDPAGVERPFLSCESLSKQGFSFFLGLCGLYIGLRMKHWRLVAISCLGWITLLWLLLVDMGEFRPETLRLMLFGHIALGGSAGLVLGTAAPYIESIFRRFPLPSTQKASRLLVAIFLAGMGLWLARGNLDKFANSRQWNVPANWRKMVRIHRKDPENWLSTLRMKRIDAAAVAMLSDAITSPKERVLLRVDQSRDLIDGQRVIDLAMTINTGSETGAGVVGVSYAYSSVPTMAKIIYPYDYRSTLFWLLPTKDLLQQLAPNWIVVDRTTITQKAWEQLLRIPGINTFYSLQDEDGRERMILHVDSSSGCSESECSVNRLTLMTSSVNTEARHIAEILVQFEPNHTRCSPKIGMIVLSERGELVNSGDIPMVVTTPVQQGGQHNLQFAMIQPGNWNVYFVDIRNMSKLHELPLKVHVNEKHD